MAIIIFVVFESPTSFTYKYSPTTVSLAVKAVQESIVGSNSSFLCPHTPITLYPPPPLLLAVLCAAQARVQVYYRYKYYTEAADIYRYTHAVNGITVIVCLH